MKKIILILFMLISVTQLQAQIKVTFIVKETTTIKHDSIFVTGSFSNWDSTANPAYLMKPYGEKGKTITLNLKPGKISYKFHRGSWFTVEKQFMGEEVPDRIINIRKDTVLKDEINSWRDEFLIDKWKTLSLPIPDTTRMMVLSSLANLYAFYFDYVNTDSAFYYTEQALQLLQKMKTSSNTVNLISLQEITATLLHSLGNYPKALEIRLENLKLAEKEKDKIQLFWALDRITRDYFSMKDYHNMLYYAKQQDSVLATLDKNEQRLNQSFFWAKYNVASAYYRLNKLSSALAYAKQAININNFDSTINARLARDIPGRQLIGDIYSAMGISDSAMKNYKFIIASAPPLLSINIAFAQTRTSITKEFQKAGRIDSALFYGRTAFSYYQNNEMKLRAWGANSLYYIAELSPLLAELYKSNNQPDSAYKYLQLSISTKESLFNADKIRQYQTLSFNEANRRLQLEQQSREERQRYETNIKMYGLISIITGFVVLAFVLYRNNRQKQKANALLQSQKQEIEATLSELKTTQAQLIQSEKLASLGELTAGIAHEIQNPLNFVNNFSELNRELISEMEEEIEKGNLSEVKLIATDLAANEEKINHHGQRASGIVKSMLEHSRTSSGTKEPTDLNALADEYLRLAYHGLRAKDSGFNAKYELIADPDLPKVNVVPQEMGRVLLNLISNAFYAVHQRKIDVGAGNDAGTGNDGIDHDGIDHDVETGHALSLQQQQNQQQQPPQQHTPYQPTVTISTRKIDNHIVITVKDNGNGIPESIKDKIFQPFFTTKPTGQGTGLGLSLAYDIVTKGHGGTLTVESEPGEGTTFVIQLQANGKSI